MTLFLGKRAAIKPHGLDFLSVYSTGKLPMPPKSVDAPKVARIGMDLNDTYGDCVIAGVDHLLGAWDAEYRQGDRRPDDPEIKATYFNLTNGQDTGLNESVVLDAWRRSGLFGGKIRAYAPVANNDLRGIQQAIAFYGGVMFGIQCPASAQEDFAAGAPWVYDPESPIEGGHCIVGVGYTPTSVLCYTWGALVEVTYPFILHNGDEAWCVISNQLVEANGDSLGIDLRSLEADLPRL